MPRSVSSLYGSSPCPPATTRRRLCYSYVRPNHNSRDRQLPSRDSFPPRGVGRFKKAKISYACSPQLLEATIRCASQRPSHTRTRALQRQSSSASVDTRLSATLLQLEPIFILRCGPRGTMIYS